MISNMNIYARIFLLTLISIVSISATNAQSRLLKGTVTESSTGKGIQGVSVTDGFSVVNTDAGGVYSFYPHPEAQFVYISIPAGFSIPTEKFLPKFYQQLSRAKTRYNFQLVKEATDDSRHVLIVGADPQPANEEASQKWLHFARNYFKPVTERYADLSKIGILCGDIVGDDLSLYANHKEAIASMRFPVFQVAGNHDNNYEARSDDGSVRTFRETFGPEYYSFNKGRIHYVVLDNVFYLGKEASYLGYLSERQLNWLENDLKLVPAGTTVIVSAHMPFEVDNRKPQESDPLGMPGSNVITNLSHFYKLLAPYTVHLMSGHTHWHQQFEKNGIFHHIHGAICGAWWGGNTSFDGTPLGFAVYEIDGDSLSWYYQSAGHDRDHQMQLTYVDSSSTVIANVWDWDDKWKVELIADGKDMGGMMRYIGYSPVMSDYYNSLPPGSPWMKPVLTGHLFKMRVPAGTARITVKVTDRFGRIYKESMAINNK